ncbi:MAG: phage terminase large subunit family protein [DPANN group archaeon]|nr:phage terminase large subunit family protein [DPANN group archaeon]
MVIKYPDIDNTNYFTNRALCNKEGEKTGKILMFREKGKEEFYLRMKCPYCGHMQEREEKFEKKPYRPACEECGKKIAIVKLKKQ